MFWRDQRGAIAILFAVAVVPLALFLGVAVDYGHAHLRKTELQAAVDAMVLAAASKPTATDAERVSFAETYFSNTYAGREIQLNVASEAGSVSAQAIGAVPTSFMKLAGWQHVNIHASARAAQPKLVDAEVALVLDYSGSMNRSGKYQAMRDAAITLVNDLLSPTNQTTTGNVKIGLVPFSDFVYLDVSSTYLRDVHPDKFGVTVRACIDARRYPSAVRDTTPDSATADTKWPAPGMPEEWMVVGALAGLEINTLATDDSVCQPKTEAECIAERDAFVSSGQLNFDSDKHETYVKNCTSTLVSTSDQCQKSYTTDEKAGQDQEALTSDFAASSPKCAAYRDRNLLVTPLTTNQTALINQLNLMAPIRLTNISLGLEMGWHLLSRNAPRTEGVAYGDDATRKVIVLLTDGRQTVGGWGAGGAFSNGQADQNTVELCTGIKAKDVTVITVAFDLNDNATKQRLQNCASGPEYFFSAATNTDLATAFKKITETFYVPVHLTE
jgi:Flp pilus assembly protein TadG